jgi:phytoene desaturase
MDKKLKVAVIGSGFGGLAVACRLAGQGLDVTVVEKRDKPGGRAYVYEDEGFTFDAGPTVITAPTCLEEVFESAGEKLSDYVELMPVSPLYRLKWEDGYEYDYTNDMPRTLEQIEKKSPVDVEGYKKFLSYTEKVFEEGYTKLAHVPFLKPWSMVKVSPQLLKLKAYRSVYSRVSQFIRDPQLREAFSFHSLLVGGNPFETSSIYTLIHFLERKWGVFFPRGGTGALVRGLVQLLEKKSGRIRYNSEVKQIRVDHGKVRGLEYQNGEFEAFDLVVSNADVNRTYEKLLEKTKEAKWSRWYVRNARYSMSLFVMYFGTRVKYPHVAHHTILFGKRYKGLLDDIFHNGVLSDDFSLYLHAPTVTDPTLAPEGCEGFYVLSPVPHLGLADIDWAEAGPRYAKRILEYLEKNHLPNLQENLVTQRIFTPQDFKTELNAHLGSAFSLEPVLRQSAYFRVHNRDPKIEGLYFVGAGTHPGAGIPGVVGSAKATASVILEDLKAETTAPKPVSIGAFAEGMEVVAAARERIRTGSLSFNLASKLFPEDLQRSACLLYLWCRHADDVIDGAENPEQAAVALVELRSRTVEALQGQVSGAKEAAPFQALRILSSQYAIPEHYFVELVEGMRMDVEGFRYETLEDLVLYSYRVAGCVGLVMSHIMKLSQTSALKHACDMGIAMQLTNIARDVAEDYSQGRIYFPKTWLDELGVQSDELMQLGRRDELVQLTQRLLAEADRRYASGIQGLKYLPLKAAFAVAAAASVYSEIGNLVLQRGPRAWESRTVVGPIRKVWALLRGVGWALKTLPQRWRRPFEAVTIDTVWRHA